MPAGVVTLLEVRNRCKQESDNVGQSFIADAEWDSYICSSFQDLYGNIVEHFGNDYFTQTPTGGYSFTTDGINQMFALPDGSGASPAFFKLLGVDLQVTSTQWVSLKPFAFADRNRLSMFNSQIPPAGQVLRVFYVPRLVIPTVDASTLDGVNGWEEFIIIDACIKALAKEESDVSVFMARRQLMETRLASEIENRDASSGGAIVDTRGRRARGMQYRLNANNLWLIGGGTPGWGWQGDWDGEEFGGFW